ncbi:MAG: hypothetical protein R6V28_00115 [Nitriliruptoraceae bacterium]
MTDDEVVVDDVAAHASEQGRITVSSEATGVLEVIVPAGVGVPGAEEAEFAAALVSVLLRHGAALPAVLDVSAAIATDPGLLPAVTERLEQRWEQEG